MNEHQQRARAVEAALAWKDTPFAWGACLKGVGVDCGRILASVANEAGAAKIDLASLPVPPPDWFRHREARFYIDLVKQYAGEYSVPADKAKPEPGDIVLAKFGHDWAHGAIVIEWPKVIAAIYGNRVAVWNSIFRSPHFVGRELKYFDPWRRAA
jgi:cell wall-associated NlpC family hydrolase